MARLRSTITHIFLLAVVMIPEFLLAVPVTKPLKEDGGEEAASPHKLIRNRRNISWYKQHSDFWNWYKYFTDNGNQDGVAELDRVYLAYLQNKNRAEGQRSYKLYLQHLSDIYKSCSESDDPNCVASYTGRPKSKVEVPRPAPMKSCDPRDPYCLYSLGYAPYPYMSPAPAKAAAPAPVKAPAYLRTPVVKDPVSGYYFYSPAVQSFLTAEQKAELLRICDAEDVECLQYHLRAAYGYKPAVGAYPSSYLGCDPKTDPSCVPHLVQKAPSGTYLRYPYCDPRVDPYCAYAAGLSSDAPHERPCNPLFEENCNPLRAMRFASLAVHPEEHKDDPAASAGAMRAPPGPRHDPADMYQDSASAAALRMRPPQPRQPLPPPTHEESRHPLGPPGKTRDGYDCFIGYDEDCHPVRAQNEPPSPRQVPHSAEPYEPHLNVDGTRSGVIEPDPDCDPEYDSNCRLRRYESEADEQGASGAREEKRERLPANAHREEPVRHEEAPRREDIYPRQQMENQGYDQQHYDPYMSGQEDPYATYGPQEPGAVSFQDLMRGYGGRYPGQGDPRAYTDYKKK